MQVYTFRIDPSKMHSTGLSSKKVFEDVPVLDNENGNSHLYDIMRLEAETLSHLINNEDNDNYITSSITDDVNKDLIYAQRDAVEIDRHMTNTPILYRSLYCHMLVDRKKYLMHTYTWVDVHENKDILCMSSVSTCSLINKLSWKDIDVLLSGIKKHNTDNGNYVVVMRPPDVDIFKLLLNRYHTEI
jgi:hypothetical protein